jgi:2-C-methyl-D-erythritol 4-phosphate cytidylyltransferase
LYICLPDPCGQKTRWTYTTGTVVLYLHRISRVVATVAQSHDDQSTGTNGDLDVVIVAAGASRRMGGIDKILSPVLGRALISHTLRVFNDSDRVSSIVLVVSDQNLDACRRLVDDHGLQKVQEVCEGGARRQDSVRLGLQRLHGTSWTAVHDGARPLVDARMIESGVAAANETGAAMAAVPIKDTIKSADTDGIVLKTVDRDGLWTAQTPQVFRYDLIAEAHRRVTDDVTDDASMVERIGGKVKLFMGSYDNLKVTAPEDLRLVEALLKARETATS